MWPNTHWHINILNMDVTTASAIAMAQNAICFASIFYFCPETYSLPQIRPASLPPVPHIPPRSGYTSHPNLQRFLLQKKFISFSYSAQSIFVLQTDILWLCNKYIFFLQNAKSIMFYSFLWKWPLAIKLLHHIFQNPLSRLERISLAFWLLSHKSQNKKPW